MERIFAARIKNEEILMKCSSGGAFLGIASQFDFVICSVYDYKANSQRFVVVHEQTELKNAVGSKYIESNLAGIFREAEKLANENPDKSILFVGMGCQAAGFTKYVEKKGIRERFCVVDIICHGVPSAKIWREYAKLLGEFSFLTFKDKTDGWSSPRAYVKIDDEEKSINPFVRIYYDGVILRPACYECRFARINRVTDMTIGDFWNIENNIPDFYSERGTSLVIVHSDKGLNIWENINDEYEWRECSREQCWQENLEYPTERPTYRDRFWKDYKRYGIQFVIKRYGTDCIDAKIMRKIRFVMEKLRING